MTAPLITDDEPLIEPEAEPQIEPEPEPEVEPEAAPAAMVSVPLVEVLPADFPLPTLIRFVPDARLRDEVDKAATYALAVEVKGPEGLRLADAAIVTLNAAMKAVEHEFHDPCDTANQLHKRLTSLRGEWLAKAEDAKKTLGNRIWQEKRRIEAEESERRRKLQEEEDRKLREQLKAQAEEARRQQAPAPVVEEMQRQAETATAPPVSSAMATTAALKGSSTVTTWKARLKGTPASDAPNPEIAELTPAQRLQVFHLIVGVAARLADDLKLDPRNLASYDHAPLAALAIDWSYVNKRAKADKGTFSIPGLEAFEDGGVRAKGRRA